MTAHTEFFGSRHPILCAAMNQVSDAALAIAVHNAGAFPSLSIPNYIRNGAFDMDAYERELRTYKEATGSDNLLLSIGGTLLLHDAVMRPFLDLGFRHIELFHWASTEPGWERSSTAAEDWPANSASSSSSRSRPGTSRRPWATRRCCSRARKAPGDRLTIRRPCPNRSSSAGQIFLRRISSSAGASTTRIR